MSNSIINDDKIVVDLYDQKISKLPIEDTHELENVLIHVAQRLADNNDAIILEALLNTLVDYYVFDLEPGDDIEDVGFLVSDIEDRVCNAIALRRYLSYRVSDDGPGIEVRPLTPDDIREINARFGIIVPEDDEDDVDVEEIEDDEDHGYNNDLEEEDEEEYEAESPDYIQKNHAVPNGRNTLPEQLPVIQPRCRSQSKTSIRDSDDVSDKDIPGMMKRFESDGFEVTVTLVPKRELDAE